SQTLATAWKPYMETCIKAFGARRCMFESNFPVDKGSYGYGEGWNAFKLLAKGASAEEKRALFHDTATRFYRLDEVEGSSNSVSSPAQADGPVITGRNCNQVLRCVILSVYDRFDAA